MKKNFFTLALLLVIVFSLSDSASAATSVGIKPGSFFYFFDTTFEQISLFFTFSSEKKAKKALVYADERLAEVEALAEDKNPNAVKTAITNYESNIALAAKKSKEVQDKGKAENLLTLIANNASKNQEVLSAVLIKVPDEAKEAITQAIEASKKGQEEATRQIAELKSEVEQLKKEVAELKAKDEAQTKAVEELSKQKSESGSAPAKSPTLRPRLSETIQNNKQVTSNQSQALPKANEPQSIPSANQQPTNTITSPPPFSVTPSQIQNQTQAPQLSSYKLSILSFEPIYADIDYETPPNRTLNHYKLEIQFDDENSVVNFIDGNLKIFLENKFFQGIIYFGGEQYSLSNLPIYDNFKETETKLSNPFIFKYTLTRFPKNQNELDNYFLTATYKDQRYRIPIGSYFNFEHIPECDQLVSDFMNNADVIGFFGGKGWYSSERLNSVKNNFSALVKQKQCYVSLRYTEMRACFLNLYSSTCTTLKENST